MTCHDVNPLLFKVRILASATGPAIYRNASTAWTAVVQRNSDSHRKCRVRVHRTYRSAPTVRVHSIAWLRNGIKRRFTETMLGVRVAFAASSNAFASGREAPSGFSTTQGIPRL